MLARSEQQQQQQPSMEDDDGVWGGYADASGKGQQRAVADQEALDGAIGDEPLSSADVRAGIELYSPEDAANATAAGAGDAGGKPRRRATPTRRAARRQQSSRSRGKRRPMSMQSPVFDDFDREVDAARTPPGSRGADGAAADTDVSQILPSASDPMEEFANFTSGGLAHHGGGDDDGGPPDDLVAGFDSIL